MLAMNHHFILEFERVGGASSHLGDQVVRIADALHADPDLIDVSVSADLAAGRVEFELGADAPDVATALDVVTHAAIEAMHAAGGHVTEALYPHQARIAGTAASDMWRQRRTELADA